MKKKEHYIIDGYNVIYAWPKLLDAHDLEEARDKLIHILAEYAGYERQKITIVFDAPLQEGEETHMEITKYLEVIYTGAGETADSCIERLAYLFVREFKEVHVVTSDGAEQSLILGAGAYRIPSRELYRRIERVKKKLHEDYLGEVTLPLKRNEVASHLDATTLKKLDALRKKQD